MLTFALAFGLSAALVHAFIRWSTGRGIVAVENHRTMHTGEVPTGGGLPLLVSAVFSALLFWPSPGPVLLLVLCALVLAAVSWINDRAAIRPAIRLAVHLAAAAVAVALLPGDALVFQGALPFALDRLVAAVALTWFMNLYNFMDGIDGIAGVETIALTAGYVAVSVAAGSGIGLYGGLALALAGATLGFLVWNWAPARVFLGDVGSVPLGFVTGAMMLDLATRSSLAAALILPLYFAADASITLARRLLEGAKPWEPHRIHFYQRAARALGSHAAVTGRVVVANGILIIVAVLAITGPLPAFLLALAVVAALLVNLELAARQKA